MITNSNSQNMIEDFVCVDPDVGEAYLEAYRAKTLTQTQQQEFEDHLVFCLKCQRDLKYLQWVVRHLKEHQTQIFPPHSEPVQLPETPLPVSAVSDGKAQDLMHDYYEKPLQEQFAASAEHPAELTFPITVEYAEGQVIGQFLKRTGYLFFRLKKNRRVQEGAGEYRLVYTSPHDPADTRIFTLQEGDDRCLGLFSEFVPSKTIQGMVAAIRQFQLAIKRQ